MFDHEIIALADRLAGKCSRDPFQLAEGEDVNVSFCRLQKQAGAYYVVRGYPILLLNEQLVSPQTEMVCAHEMGHHILHAALLYERRDTKNPKPLDRETIYRTEREANLFAASFLLSDETVAKPMSQGISVLQVAKALSLPWEFVQMKALALRVKGQATACAEPDPCFLRYAVAVR